MSSKLKDIVEMHLTGNEQITWVEVKVIGRSEQRIFYILRFEKKLDVLDTTKTIYVQGTDHIIKPVFSLQKIKNFSIFHKPLSHNLWRITSALYISDALKKSIQRAKLSGIDFEKVAVA